MTQLINFLRDIQQKGLKINAVYDIGAWVGHWSKNIKSVIPEAQFILFEANPAYKNELENSGFIHFCGVALSSPGKKLLISTMEQIPEIATIKKQPAFMITKGLSASTVSHWMNS